MTLSYPCIFGYRCLLDMVSGPVLISARFLFYMQCRLKNHCHRIFFSCHVFILPRDFCRFSELLISRTVNDDIQISFAFFFFVFIYLFILQRNFYSETVNCLLSHSLTKSQTLSQGWPIQSAVWANANAKGPGFQGAPKIDSNVKQCNPCLPPPPPQADRFLLFLGGRGEFTDVTWGQKSCKQVNTTKTVQSTGKRNKRRGEKAGERKR